MGYELSLVEADRLLENYADRYAFYAPKVFEGSGCFSDTDTIRYGEIHSMKEIEFDRKSDYSFKEVLLPISQTLFYFTEDEIKESSAPAKIPVLFLRSCDIHALKRMDDIYLHNTFEDHYYKRVREHLKVVLIGCRNAFESCFCVDMGTNKTSEYDAYVQVEGDRVLVDGELPMDIEVKQVEVTPLFAEENVTHVTIPENLNRKVANAGMWQEYDSRCIACGRCNFVCPTCTCFTMQDIFYRDNANVGERRRVWASCQVDGFTSIAGGISFRKKKGERMRYKVMHKVHDFKEKHGYHMCVGCGRCDDVCPEYISFSACVNKLEDAMKEVNENEE